MQVTTAGGTHLVGYLGRTYAYTGNASGITSFREVGPLATPATPASATRLLDLLA